MDRKISSASIKTSEQSTIEIQNISLKPSNNKMERAGSSETSIPYY